MNTVLHIPVTPPSFILFSFSHPRLPLIFQGFSVSPPSSFRFLSPPSLAANPLLLPPLHPLLPEGFEKLLHNALQIITMHALWIRVGWGVVIRQTLQDLIRSKAMKQWNYQSLALQIKWVNLSCSWLLRLKEIVLSVAACACARSCKLLNHPPSQHQSTDNSWVILMTHDSSSYIVLAAPVKHNITLLLSIARDFSPVCLLYKHWAVFLYFIVRVLIIFLFLSSF